MNKQCTGCVVSAGTHKPAETVLQIDEPQVDAMRGNTAGGVRCHDADACAFGQKPCPTTGACGCVAPAISAKKMKPGDELHLSLLMAPHGLNLLVGQDRVQLLAYARDVWNAAQQAAAPQAVPFMWAIREPGGGAYMDDGCVSSVREDVEAEVDGLNSGLDADDEPYMVVPVYLAATQPAAQGMDAFRALYDSVVHSIDEGLLTGKALEAIILVPAVDFFESAKQTYTKEPQSELELNSARWKHVTNEAGTGMVSLVRFASNGSPCALIGSEANSFVDAALAAQAKQGDQA